MSLLRVKVMVVPITMCKMYATRWLPLAHGYSKEMCFSIVSLFNTCIHMLFIKGVYDIHCSIVIQNAMYFIISISTFEVLDAFR